MISLRPLNCIRCAHSTWEKDVNLGAFMHEAYVIDRDAVQQLLDALHLQAYNVIGPVERSGSITYEPLRRTEQMPVGKHDQQEGGTFRLVPGDGASLFAYAVGSGSVKQHLFKPHEKLFAADRGRNGFSLTEEVEEEPPLALFGVRSCDLHAIALQDQVFMEGAYPDASYSRRRRGMFVVAVNCGHPGGTCFCDSMGTGPAVTQGFDLALTELEGKDDPIFVVKVGSDAGQDLLGKLPCREASPQELQRAESVVQHARENMGRHMDTKDLKELLHRQQEHPRWQAIAERCLACANCTMACPTCFCSTVEDVTDLSGEHAERWRKWDSCFTREFSYIHGGHVRSSHMSRYRQWLTHKLASWQDQFGSSGCVGCGRCITWCPVGIDITVEVAAMRGAEITATAP